MNRIFLTMLFTLLTGWAANGQAHLGLTEYAIKDMYPEKKWTADYTTKERIRYISADMVYGNFTYYFDKETKLSDYCMQIPFNNTTMNGQIEAYNKKYVITSDTSWTAYLDEGGIMYIKLIYDRENKISYFSYSNSK